MPKRELSSERSDWVLVTVEANDVRLVWFAQYAFLDRTWWDPEEHAVHGVTAWRELPEPFDRSMPRPAAAAAGYRRSDLSAR